jgi:hypothetical protein
VSTQSGFAGIGVMRFDASREFLYLASGTFGGLCGASNTSVIRVRPGEQCELDASWNPGVGGLLLDVQLGNDGWVYLAGDLSDPNGQSLGKLRRVSRSAGAALDPGWAPVFDAQSYVHRVRKGPQHVFACCDYDQSMPGQLSGFLRFDLISGAPSPAWIGPPSVLWGTALALDTQDGVLAAFDRVSTIDGHRTHHLGRYAASGAGLGEFELAVRGIDGTSVSELIDVGSGTTLVAGTFTEIDGEPRVGLAAVTTGPTVLLQDGFEPPPARSD